MKNLRRHYYSYPQLHKMSWLTYESKINMENHIEAKSQQIDLKSGRLYWLIGAGFQHNPRKECILYKSIYPPIYSYLHACNYEYWNSPKISR